VARCINREVKAGRGSPHGGVFLDIAWIKSRVPNGAEHIKKKLPSMYHQFKQLADLDITQEPMEIGPTTHYIMGGVRVDADSQMSSVPGLFAAGECAAGINGATGSEATRCPTSSCSASAPASTRRKYAQAHDHGRPATTEVDEAARLALEPFDRGPSGEGPYQVQYALQEMMQSLVGIVRNEPEMQRRALDGLGELRARAARVGRRGSSRVQPRLARRARSAQPADRVGSDHAMRDRTQGKPRRSFPGRPTRTSRARSAPSTSSCARDATARWRSPRARFPKCRPN
jgi:succinate dehydrogenase / fumarate reductase flavoprotein subunit